ncbi:GNAT family N-acetyltransferase [Winogradskya consettensis]|uniref:Acetyltransferase n=1 Tax=Winogradskya consettensis TaxID=113560 RepID=A0A919SDI5_9ACTN|nr:GNAT family N-acetyltransferase [Actinoplanes consettensis]GIM70650.1 acetyltransferase [Actinoplanes consettensis]
MSTTPEPSGGLTLRPWHDNDAAALVAVADDPALHRWTGMRAGDTTEALRWLAVQHAGLADGSRYTFAVVDDGQHLLGHVVLKRGERPENLAEVGYWVAAPARGRGVAPRAVTILTGWSFTRFPELTRVELRHQSDNTASCRVAVKCGYAYEATLAAAHPYPQTGHLHALERTL